MSVLWPALIAAVAAQDRVVAISEEQLIDVGGGWHRTMPADEGWHLLFAAGGDYNHAPLSNDWQWDDQERRGLTGHTNLQDHAITRCPDGTWLHVASATLDSPNDSAYVFTYDADFQRIASLTLEERAPERKHNDPLVACTDTHRLVGFTNPALEGGTVFSLSETLEPGAPQVLEGAPTLSGSSALADGDDLLIFGFALGTEDRDLLISRYDASLALVETQRRSIAPEGLRAYWPQGVLRVGDHVLLAFMARDDDAGWSGDTGDLWLAVLDATLTPVELHQISQNTPPSGGMRPFLSRKDDTLLLAYDRDVRPRLFTATLDLDALGATGDDTGVAPGKSAPCGCQAGPGPDLALAALAAALSARTRGRPRSRSTRS